MELRYSRHLALRLKMRSIPEDLPRSVVTQSRQRFIDTETGLHAAVFRMRLHGKTRDVTVLYREHTGYLLLVTVHPLKSGQLENRLKSGRWKIIGH